MQNSPDILSLISPFFLLLLLFGVGSRFSLPGEQSKVILHFRIAIGYGLFFILYNLLVPFLAPFALHVTLWVILLLFAVINSKHILQSIKAFKFKLNFEYLFFIALFIPHIFRVLSPPTSDDGPSFYLPNIQWIYFNGLSFNPYQTAYTTMPLGAEELFSMVYPYGGYYSVRILDALFCLLLFDLLYDFVVKFIGKNLSRSFLILILLLPGTFFFLFGTGKVDVLNTYFMTLGFVLFLKYWNTKNLPLVIVVFSLSLSIKYTSWLLLAVPLFLLCAAYIYQNAKRNFWIFFVPLFFVAPTLIKNQVQVNNPLASIFNSPNQTQFIWKKGSLPERGGISKIAVSKNKSSQLRAFLKTIQDLTIPILLVFVIIIGLLQFLNKIQIPQLWLWMLFLFSSFSLWFYFLGTSPQPMRFAWLQVIICLILIGKSVDFILTKYFANSAKVISTVLFAVLFASISYKIVFRHGYQIPAFFKAQKMELSDWYLENQKDHYGFSVAFKEGGFHYKDVAYLTHVAKGFFDVGDYGNIPTDLEYHRIKKNYPKAIAAHRYLLCTKKQRAIKNLDKYSIIIQKGNYFLLDKQLQPDKNEAD